MFTDYSEIVYTILLLIPSIHVVFTDNQLETLNDCTRENNRQASRLSTSHTTREVERLPTNRRLHELCGTGFNRYLLIWLLVVYTTFVYLYEY